MLTVIDVTRPTNMVRGYLQRYLLEIRAGLFVGDLPKRVQHSLWEVVLQQMVFGNAIMITEARNEAGYEVFTHGKNRREPVENFGIYLIEYQRNFGCDSD